MKRPTPALSDPNWSTQVPRGIHSTKKILFCLQNFNKTASVTDMLSDLKWDTLETRKKNRLTLMYKLSYNLVDINKEEYLVPNREKKNTQ